MRELLKSALVIGRRDFVATVYSRSFILFLLAPVLIIAISGGFGALSANMAQQESRPTVAVIASPAEFAEIRAAYDRMEPAFGAYDLPELRRDDPARLAPAQVKRLLTAPDKRILAVLTGGVDRPKLTGAIDEHGQVLRQMRAVIQDARQQRALAHARTSVPPVSIEMVKVEESTGSLATARSITARLGQTLLFMFTLFLATMLLSNLVEEKSGKIIEVLAAALPIDAIFFGKLGAMLCVSLVGVGVWTLTAVIGVNIWSHSVGAVPEPAVGWPVFVFLVFAYFATNYLLLGALFLGIGSQASTVREVQTLSMPVTMAQLLIFLFASIAAGRFNGPFGIAAAIFPFSSPLTMIARAAQTPELWPHLAALLWQLLWVWLTVRLGAAFFRRNVLKSGGGPAAAFGWRRRG
ncbi:MAG: transporter permease [Alphaproteobacteria bacterium]|nr:transporter permease [Alphaproteobacteria bacterium]